VEKVARPIRICLTGAESTGKTELAKALSRHFSAPMVAEFSREYAQRAGRDLSFMDVMPIAKGQMELEENVSSGAALVILDTDLLSTVSYSRHHFGASPVILDAIARKRLADLYLLLDIDVPWVGDPVRDSGATREALHERFCDVLDEFGANVRTIRGNWDERLKKAIEVIRECPVPSA
jgi:NadR type nicotinamide-nucleotide adenylyltransferase